MAEQRASLTLCEICGETMNRQDRQPVCLPGCGHSFCRSCLIKINNVHEHIKCPTCRCLHRGLPPEELPVNWALMALLEPENEEANKSKTTNEAPPTADSKHNSNESSKDKQPDGCKGSSSDCNPDEGNSNSGSSILKKVGIAGAAVIGGVGLVAAAPVVLTGVGFTSAGIAGGSWAAGMMSSAAIANGGGVAAGSLVAVLQSAGAAGIGTTATAALGGTGAGLGATIGYGFSKLFGRSSGTNEGSNQNDGNDDGDDGGEGKEGKDSSKESKESDSKSNKENDEDKCDTDDEGKCDTDDEDKDESDKRKEK